MYVRRTTIRARPRPPIGARPAAIHKRAGAWAARVGGSRGRVGRRGVTVWPFRVLGRWWVSVSLQRIVDWSKSWASEDDMCEERVLYMLRTGCISPRHSPRHATRQRVASANAKSPPCLLRQNMQKYPAPRRLCCGGWYQWSPVVAGGRACRRLEGKSRRFCHRPPPSANATATSPLATRHLRCNPCMLRRGDGSRASSKLFGLRFLCARRRRRRSQRRLHLFGKLLPRLGLGLQLLVLLGRDR